MSSPMFETPLHQMIPVDKDGNGPCSVDEQWGFRCWCGVNCGNVEHFRDLDGTPFCADPGDFDRSVSSLAMIEVTMAPRPGFCTACHAFGVDVMLALTEPPAEP